MRGDALEFTVPRPLNGNLDVRIGLTDADGRYLPAAAAFALAPHVPAEHTTPDLVLLAAGERGRSGDVTLRASDAQSGKALAGLPLSLAAAPGDAAAVRAVTDADGRAALLSVPPGGYLARFAGDKQLLPARAPLLHAGSSLAELGVSRRAAPAMVFDAAGEDWGAHAGREVCLSVVGHDGRECRLTPATPQCAFAEYVPGSAHRRVRLRKLVAAHYLAYLCSAELPTGDCPVVRSECSYRDRSPAHALGLPARPRPAGFVALSCFTGWGATTLRAFRRDTPAPPSATLCAPLYPAGSPWSLAALRAANAA